MVEIKAITTKYDIAAFILLHDEAGFSEYSNIVRPSYSCIELVERAGFVVKLEGSKVGKQEAKRLADGTYKLINHFAFLLMKHAVMYMEADEMLKKMWGASEGKGRDTSHRDQNQ